MQYVSNLVSSGSLLSYAYSYTAYVYHTNSIDVVKVINRILLAREFCVFENLS